jgi:hypothetical protein
MDSVALSGRPIHLGLDVSKNNIAVGILRWDEQVPDTEMLFNDEPSVRRLINRHDPAPARSGRHQRDQRARLHGQREVDGAVLVGRPLPG